MNEPRRFGKTQTLQLLVHRAPPEWTAVLVSFDGVTSTEQLVHLLLARLLSHRSAGARMATAMKAVVRHVTGTKTTVEGVTVEFAPVFAADPLAALEQALRQVAQHLGDEHLLLACDEVPDAVRLIAEHEGDEAAVRLLGTLRRLREDRELSPIRWLLTGSVGFHHVLRTLGQRDTALNELAPAQLGPLMEADAVYLARCLLLGSGRPDDPAVAAAIAKATDGIPFLAHLLVHEARGEALTVSNADDVLHRAAADLDRSAQLTPLLTRLDPYYGADKLFAESLLDALAAAPARREDLSRAHRRASVEDVRRVLTLLQLDHYVDHDGNGLYGWRYPALAGLWRARRA